MNTQSTNIG